MRQALTIDDVIEIAATFLEGELSMEKLAREYGVSRHTVCAALDGQPPYQEMQRYLPVAKIKAMLYYRRHTTGAYKLALFEVVQLRTRFRRGASARDLAQAYQLTTSEVFRIVRGDAYRLAGGPVYNPQRRTRNDAYETS